MRKMFTSLAVAAMVWGSATVASAQQTSPPANPPATNPDRQEPGLGERLGERLDRGLSKVGEEVRRGWEEIRGSVDRLSVQGRVYSRLRWDKLTHDANIDIDVQDENIVTLKGQVANRRAQQRAVLLAQETVGVERVVDELTALDPSGDPRSLQENRTLPDNRAVPPRAPNNPLDDRLPPAVQP